MGTLQQPRLSWASLRISQANPSGCQCVTVINLPHHNLTGYRIKLVVSAKSNGQRAASGYGTRSVPRLEQWWGKTEQPVLAGVILIVSAGI